MKWNTKEASSNARYIFMWNYKGDGVKMEQACWIINRRSKFVARNSLRKFSISLETVKSVSLLDIDD